MRRRQLAPVRLVTAVPAHAAAQEPLRPRRARLRPRRRPARRPAPCRAGRRRPCRRAPRSRRARGSTALSVPVRSSVTPTTMPALPSSRHADDGDDARAEPLLALVGEALEVAASRRRDTARASSLMPPTSRTGSSPAAAAAHGELPARLGELALELAAILDQRGETLGRLLDGRLQQARERAQPAALVARGGGARASPVMRLDAADARRRPRLRPRP